MFRFLLIGLLVVVNFALASDLSQCASNGTGSLFACLNQSAQVNAVPLKGNNGHWVYTVQPDKDSDKPNVFMATLLSSSRIHYLDHPVSMTIRCKEKKANFEIRWQGMKLKEGSPSVVYHFDEKSGKAVHWITAIGRQSLEVDKPMDFIKQLSKTNFFMVQASADQSPTINATFHTNGLKNLMPVMKGLCY